MQRMTAPKLIEIRKRCTKNVSKKYLFQITEGGRGNLEREGLRKPKEFQDKSVWATAPYASRRG